MNSPHTIYRPDIDGLRAVAVLAVLFFHAFPAVLPGGFIGVDIFFVISGYLITTILLKNLTSNQFSFVDFYSRRIRRIFPALITMLIVALILGFLILLPDELISLGKHVAAGGGFISNLVLWSESGYFDANSETKPLLHLWSLGVEEQFYFFFPILLWAAHRLRLNLLKFIGAIAAISFALNISNYQSDVVSNFYSPQTRFWEIMLGAILATRSLKTVNVNSSTGTLLLSLKSSVQSFLGVALLGVSLVLMDKTRLFPGFWAVLPTLGAALIIHAGPHAWVNSRLLSNRFMVGVGLLSFPLYL